MLFYATVSLRRYGRPTRCASSQKAQLAVCPYGGFYYLLEVSGAKALGTEDLRIEVKEDKVAFPWFSEVDADHAAAYTRFIAALCEMSRNAKRVTAKEKEVENEKYAFRCFLLRLGFIGAEYKKDRRILLENLTGSSAFRNGGADHEISE